MKFFLNSFHYTIFFSIFFFLWLFGLYWLLFIALFIFSMFLLFSRRLPPAFQEDEVLKEGILYAPVNGKVALVNEGVVHGRYGNNLTEIVIVSSWWREHGIYFPLKAEIIDLAYQGGKGHFRYFYKSIFSNEQPRNPSLSLGMRCVNNIAIGIDFYKCLMGMWPRVRVIPGDKGKAQVNLGFFGLGGTTVLYLPENYEILVKEGLDIVAGQAIVANLKDVKKVEA